MSEVEEWGDNREGEEKKTGRSLAGRLTRVCPARVKEEGDVNYPVRLESMLIPIQRQPP